MAATKKPVAKKPAVKKPTTKTTTVKKTLAKKPAVKATAAKKPAAKKAAPVKKQPSMQSFRVYDEKIPFKSFRITRQTVYWIILLCVIIFVQLWILKLQYEVVNLLDIQALEAIDSTSLVQ